MQTSQLCHSQGDGMSWGYWGQNLGPWPLSLACNPAQAWSFSPCLSRRMGPQAVANEVDLGR